MAPSFAAMVVGSAAETTTTERRDTTWRALSKLKLAKYGTISLVDFGAGKGYLTFALHDYLSHSLGLDARVRGVELRELGATPVLLTPLTRRSFKEERLDDHLAPWAAATRDVASRQSVPVIDLHRLSMQVVQNMGSVRADQLAMTPPGHADFDRTHLGARGACLFADLMSRELSAQLPGLALPRTQGQVCEQLAGQTPVMN